MRNRPAERCLRVRGRELRWGSRTYVMGIVNVTPDSFSGDGLLLPAQAVAHAVAQFEAGADLLDLGAESTRPGHDAVDAQTEIARLLPVLRSLRERLPDVPISVDTYKPEVLRAAHAGGADILNSVWGLPDQLLRAAAECGVPVVAMHNRSEPNYEHGVMEDVLRFLDDAAQRAIRAGIPEDHVMLDPGIGFGKSAEQNLEVLAQLERCVRLGFPTLLGTSRKSTIGRLTGREPADRVYGTCATTALAIAAGIDVVRVHDVAAACDAVRVSDAIVRGWRPPAWT